MKSVEHDNDSASQGNEVKEEVINQYILNKLNLIFNNNIKSISHEDDKKDEEEIEREKYRSEDTTSNNDVTSTTTVPQKNGPLSKKSSSVNIIERNNTNVVDVCSVNNDHGGGTNTTPGVEKNILNVTSANITNVNEKNNLNIVDINDMHVLENNSLSNSLEKDILMHNGGQTKRENTVEKANSISINDLFKLNSDAYFNIDSSLKKGNLSEILGNENNLNMYNQYNNGSTITNNAVKKNERWKRYIKCIEPFLDVHTIINLSQTCKFFYRRKYKVWHNRLIFNSYLGYNPRVLYEYVFPRIYKHIHRSVRRRLCLDFTMCTLIKDITVANVLNQIYNFDSLNTKHLFIYNLQEIYFDFCHHLTDKTLEVLAQTRLPSLKTLSIKCVRNKYLTCAPLTVMLRKNKWPVFTNFICSFSNAWLEPIFIMANFIINRANNQNHLIYHKLKNLRKTLETMKNFDNSIVSSSAHEECNRRIINETHSYNFMNLHSCVDGSSSMDRSNFAEETCAHGNNHAACSGVCSAGYPNECTNTCSNNVYSRSRDQDRSRNIGGKKKLKSLLNSETECSISQSETNNNFSLFNNFFYNTIKHFGYSSKVQNGLPYPDYSTYAKSSPQSRKDDLQVPTATSRPQGSVVSSGVGLGSGIGMGSSYGGHTHGKYGGKSSIGDPNQSGSNTPQPHEGHDQDQHERIQHDQAHHDHSHHHHAHHEQSHHYYPHHDRLHHSRTRHFGAHEKKDIFDEFLSGEYSATYSNEKSSIVYEPENSTCGVKEECKERDGKWQKREEDDDSYNAEERGHMGESHQNSLTDGGRNCCERRKQKNENSKRKNEEKGFPENVEEEIKIRKVREGEEERNEKRIDNERRSDNGDTQVNNASDIKGDRRSHKKYEEDEETDEQFHENNSVSVDEEEKKNATKDVYESEKNNQKKKKFEKKKFYESKKSNQNGSNKKSKVLTAENIFCMNILHNNVNTFDEDEDDEDDEVDEEDEEKNLNKCRCNGNSCIYTTEEINFKCKCDDCPFANGYKNLISVDDPYIQSHFVQPNLDILGSWGSKCFLESIGLDIYVKGYSVALKNENIKICVKLSKKIQEELYDLSKSEKYKNNNLVYLLRDKGSELLSNTPLTIETDENRGIDIWTLPISLAISKKNRYLFYLVLKGGAKIDIWDYLGKSPLYIACENESKEFVEVLLEERRKRKKKNNIIQYSYKSSVTVEREGSIVEGMNSGNDARVNDRCQDASPPPATEMEKNTPKEGTSTEEGFPDKGTSLEKANHIDKGISLENQTSNDADLSTWEGTKKNNDNCNTICVSPYGNTCDSYYVTFPIDIENGYIPLNIAIKKKNFSIVNSLVKNGENLNIICPFVRDYKSPLYLACENNISEIIQLLLENKANPNWCYHNKFTPILLAYNLNKAWVNHFIDAGAGEKPCDRHILTEVLSCAIFKNDLSTVQLLLKKYPQLLQKEHNLWSLPFIQASKLERLNILKYLHTLKKEIINQLDSNNVLSPIHAAAEEGNLEILKFLLENNVNINLTNKYHQNALHIACLENQEKAVQLLLTHNIDVNCKDNINGECPLMICIRTRNEILAHHILNQGKNINYNLTNIHGETSLIYSIFYGLYDIADVLMTRGADVSVRDINGDKSYNVACERVLSHRTCKKVLKKFLKLYRSQNKNFLPKKNKINKKNKFYQSYQSINQSFLSIFRIKKEKKKKKNQSPYTVENDETVLP
ncbi:conserved Plasmodium protein, unknown function [Plasmodium knowlesi strain H]|uniref:Ankyrin-repeat protein n=3 Tax=Plasmodium knowlesi TaxID=5850 RepID=A0A5K1V5P7_PLAKH|nr:ankyrin-repeat protein, putative [Plasmodium knowlesi strain H]OTN64518.1 Uncharacterized protein PKNOH_S130189200 [Plasmodium knowlesi]CAA9989055.1 ankyrin-repeat protein, putative [Plasmodium knowlesi strain H]SBO27267.1 conserved Plasmodium protein, unknown function [Plasmodium knowlesi strain H]SBO28896.1 conserved Plasmodium protein, unknown function [Plasmodium knowlesi strain H]VVS78529.1 ankyrin-repeat protein, putative [Plasmodium knowlesi strain H]|eukprot:XP_002261404.1 hypothetical protein, conserved in Plasmodium species [Plasmodium knowlesi strain H]